MKKPLKNRFLAAITATVIVCTSASSAVYGYALDTKETVESESVSETEGLEKSETRESETGEVKAVESTAAETVSETGKDSETESVTETESETTLETELIENKGTLVENSFRYQNGEWIHDEMPLYAAGFKPWSFTDGSWINSIGEPIVGAINKGIDVSSHRGKIDWKKVEASDVDYAIIRCGYGNNYVSQDDDYWKYNADECTRLGIPFGVYIYSYAMDVKEAKSEAEHVLRLVKGYNLSLPIYFDLEDEKYTGKLTNKEIADITEVFCDTIEAAGYDVGIYANLSWFNNRLTDPRFDQWPKWVAQYNTVCDYQGDYTMWQCTSSGIVDGIAGGVDVNFTMNGFEVEDVEPAEPPESEQDKQVRSFVERLYELILNRPSDEAGLEAWKDILINQEETGAEVARGFVFSDEFVSRKLSDDEFVEVLYETFLGRPSDSNGKEAWLKCLTQGFSREYVLKGFIESNEFNDICLDYGILRGTIPLNSIQDKNPEITKYLFRCYDVFLGRKPDEKGMIEWVESFAVRKENPAEITKGFVFSSEMIEKNLNDEEFIKIMYRGLFNRTADEAGFNDWMKWIHEGKSREDIFWGFAGSDEFRRLVQSFGL